VVFWSSWNQCILKEILTWAVIHCFIIYPSAGGRPLTTTTAILSKHNDCATVNSLLHGLAIVALLQIEGLEFQIELDNLHGFSITIELI